MDADNQAMKVLCYWLYDSFGAMRPRGQGSRFHSGLRGDESAESRRFFARRHCAAGRNSVKTCPLKQSPMASNRFASLSLSGHFFRPSYTGTDFSEQPSSHLPSRRIEEKQSEAITIF